MNFHNQNENSRNSKIKTGRTVNNFQPTLENISIPDEVGIRQRININGPNIKHKLSRNMCIKPAVTDPHFSYRGATTNKSNHIENSSVYRKNNIGYGSLLKHHINS